MRKTNFLGAEPAVPPSPAFVGEAAGAGSDAEALFQQLPWGMVVLDAHGTVLRLNAQAADWWGVLLQDTVGKPLGELAAGTLPDGLWQALQQVTSSPVPPPGEFFLPQHQQWIAMTSARRGDTWVMYWQDVTTHKQRESHQQARQAASDTLLRRTEAAARTGSYELELATGRFEFSDGLYRLFGEEPGAFVPDLALIEARSHPDDVAPVQQVLTQAVANRQPYYYQRRIYYPDGQLRTLECHGRVERDALGEPVKLLGLVQDVTEREQAAQQAKDELVRQATSNYVALYNSMDEGFCVIEVIFDAQQRATDYRFLNANPAFEQQSGLRGALGKTMRELAPDHEQHWFDAYGRVAQTGEPTRFGAHGQALGRWFDVNAFSIGPGANRHVGVLFTDITERKQQEQQQAFLLRFSDALRAETGATGVADRALGMLCEQLQLDRCYIGLYDLTGDRGIFPHQVGNHRVPPLPAEVRLSDFPDALRVASDRTLVIDDLAQTEGLSDTDRQNLGALGLRALVAATLRRAGDGPQWAIVALTADVRHWTPGEVALLEAATERTWAAMERARADAALRESEERFRAVANLGPDLLWRSTPDSDTTWYNQRWHEYTGQTLAEAAGYGWINVIHADDQAESVRRYRAAIASGQPLHQEHRIRSAQGEYRWFQVQVRPAHSAQGEVNAWFGAATDIHARKQTEEALRRAEERHREQLEQQVAERTGELQQSRHLLQTVFNASPTAIVVMRLLRDAAEQAEDFEILIFNEFNRQVTGRDDLVGQRFTAMFPQTVPTGILVRLLHVATTGEPADFEQWYEGEGMRHWFRHIVVRQEGLLVLTSEVITARKLLEQGQARSLALLLQSEAVAGMGSWEYDLRTHEFTWSDGLYRLFEQPVGSAIKPQFLLDAVLDDDRPAAARLVRTLTAEPRSFDTTLRLRIGAAVKTVRFKAVPLPEASEAPERVLGVCLDVSDVQRLEAENLALKLDRHKELLMAILQAQETERQRLGEVLHNGLGQILYATKLRLDQLDSPALQALPALASLHQETTRLLGEAMRQNRTLAHELVPTSLLDFGLAAAVRDVCRDLSTPQLRIACHVWGEEPEQEKTLPQPVQVTLFRLAQELALNIVRHAGATEATLELETIASGVSLRAEDNGHGFDPKTVAEGLGLRTVRDAVALLGGTVAVDSSPEFGTHIRLRIPLPLFS